MNVLVMFDRLAAEYDLEDWWPADSPWEVMVGAILVQQTAWENVDSVIGMMKERGLMTVDAVDTLPLGVLQKMLRSVGCYRQKARNLKALAAHLKDRHRSNPMDLLTQETGQARKELMSLPGIGEETADVILLFAGDRPRFVAAAYVSRILERTGTFSSSRYGQVQEFVSSHLKSEPRLFRHFFALLVHHARTVCRTKPRCQECCLRHDCSFTTSTGTVGSRR
jgi:endonuclease-3 related protein